MTQETMTVHEALCEAKTLESRIMKTIREITAIGTKENQASRVNGITVEEFNNDARSKSMKAEQMIDRYNAIKAAINQYNATKEITVNDKKYSVAMAVWMLQHGLSSKKNLRAWYANQLESARNTLSAHNGEKLDTRAENAASSNFGNKEKPNHEDYLKFIKDYKERTQLILVDPLNLSEKITKLDDEIAGFESRVDAALQVANATTTITIEY